MNPLSSDLNVLRETLLFGGLESIAHNVNRKNSNLRFFEFGNVYLFSPEKQNHENPMQAYKEENHLGIWLTGKRVSGNWAHPEEESSFYELKAYVGMPLHSLVVKQSENNIFHKALAVYNKGGKLLLELGILAKKLLKTQDIDAPVYYADINWSAVTKAVRKSEVLYKEISKYPPVSRDLALLLDNNVEFEAIERIAYQSEKKYLKSVELFDVYEGKNLPAGKKSYAVNFILQDEEKTLNDKQIDAIMNKLINNLKKQLHAELR